MELIRSQENPDVFECQPEGKPYSIVVMPCKSDEILASIYIRLKAEGLLPILFYQKIPSLLDFLAMYLRPEMFSLSAWIRTGDEMRLMGIGSLDIPQPIGGGLKKGEVSETFFREFQRREYTLVACQLILQWGFEKTGVFQFHGCTPVRNRAAVRFLKGLGFGSMKEELPNFVSFNGEPCGVILSWLDKNRWSEISPFEKSG
jgi:RimJ/RimL family protein N-acetyltransferase